MEVLSQRLKRPILSNASASLLVSLEEVGAADRLEAPKLLSSSAKKRLSTWRRMAGQEGGAVGADGHSGTQPHPTTLALKSSHKQPLSILQQMRP